MADLSLKDLSLADGAESAVNELCTQETELHELSVVAECPLRYEDMKGAKSKPWEDKLAHAVSNAVIGLTGIGLFLPLKGSLQAVAMPGDVAAPVASRLESYSSLMITLVGDDKMENLASSKLAGGASTADEVNKLGNEAVSDGGWWSGGVEGSAASWLHKGFKLLRT